MCFEEYLQDEQYYQIALATLRLKQIKELKESLKSIVVQCNKNKFKLGPSLAILSELRSVQTENMNTLLD